MNRTRNAYEFLLRLRCIDDEYNNKYRLLIERIRQMLTDSSEQGILDQCLEAHIRAYKVNALLSALNWNVVDDHIPNLVPEARVRSSVRGGLCYNPGHDDKLVL